MFGDPTVKTVREALLNLAITADLEHYIAKLERGKAATESQVTSNCRTSFGKKTGTISSQEPMCMWRLP